MTCRAFGPSLSQKHVYTYLHVHLAFMNVYRLAVFSENGEDVGVAFAELEAQLGCWVASLPDKIEKRSAGHFINY